MLSSLKSSIAGTIKRWVTPLMLRSPFLATLAYLKNRDFQLEAWGYVHGLAAARDASDASAGWRYRLRTHVHVLEKGLSARNRRPVFGAKLIRSAVEDFQHLQALRVQCACAADESLYAWARDVMTHYFSVVGSHPEIDAARAAFASTLEPRGDGGERLVPFARIDAAGRMCNYDQLLELARRRRSVRTYAPEKVPHDLIDRALAVAALSPSSCNRQPFHFHVVDDPAMIDKLQTIPGGITCFNHVPMLIVVTGDMRGVVESVTNRHSIYVDASLFVMSFILALETLGLSSCCVNWSETREKDSAVRGLLALPPYQRVVMFLVVGYPLPDAIVPRSHKRHLDDLRSFHVGAPPRHGSAHQ